MKFFTKSKIINRVLLDKTFYIISRKGSYSVGRKAGDIILEGDTSISRHHCTIKIAKKDDCPFGDAITWGIFQRI